MSRVRRMLLLAAGGIVVLYALVFVVWAARPLEDAVPVGVDYTIPKEPAGRLVSQEVECNSLFSSAARDSTPLPSLKAQPLDKPALKYQRTACNAVQDDARKVFALNTLLAVLGVAALLVVAARQTSHAPPEPALL